MQKRFLNWVLQVHLFATLFMTGLIWFVQVVHYPLFASVPESGFAEYEQRHRYLTTWVVAPPMLVEGLTAVLLLVFLPAGRRSWKLRAGLLLLAVIWLSTAFIQVPLHEQLSEEFQLSQHQNLIASNWIRVVAWSLRGLLALSLTTTTLKSGGA